MRFESHLFLISLICCSTSFSVPHLLTYTVMEIIGFLAYLEAIDFFLNCLELFSDSFGKELKIQESGWNISWVSQGMQYFGGPG